MPHRHDVIAEARRSIQTGGRSGVIVTARMKAAGAAVASIERVAGMIFETGPSVDLLRARRVPGCVRHGTWTRAGGDRGRQGVVG